MDPYKYAKNRVLLAPMAGYTDRTMRKLCAEFGAGLTYTEMISAKALSYSNERTQSYLSFDDFRTGIQLFGSEPWIMSEIAARITEKYIDSIAVIDINMGCPAPKITGNGEGCSLMLDIRRASEIVAAVKRSTCLPVTVKFRKGWDCEHTNSVEFAKAMENSGADGLTIHGRTRDQFYSGKVDLEIIASVKNAVSIPVNGNGDIFSPEDAVRMFEETGCDGVMVGRGALGNPFIFRMIREYMETGSYSLPGKEERLSLAKRHIELNCADKGEYTGVRELRKHLCYYLKGMKGASRIKERVMNAETRSEVAKLMDMLMEECDI